MLEIRAALSCVSKNTPRNSAIGLHLEHRVVAARNATQGYDMQLKPKN